MAQQKLSLKQHATQVAQQKLSLMQAVTAAKQHADAQQKNELLMLEEIDTVASLLRGVDGEDDMDDYGDL